MNSLSATLLVLAGFGAAMFTAGAVGGRRTSLDRFLVASRSVGVMPGALSVAATWIWAPALFIAAQKAFQEGMAGLLWFTAPNVGCLVLFAFLARRIRRLFPGGYTLPQYIDRRFDPKTHLVYVATFLALQICSLGVQLIAGGALLAAMGGVPYAAGVVFLSVIFTSYSLLDGLRASIRTDLLQLAIMFGGILILIPLAFVNGGGSAALASGLGGVSGRFSNPLDLHVAYTFGITVTIGLLSGPVGDQQHWQRAFAFKPGAAFKGYLLGAAVFAVVPLSMSVLGFLAAGNPAAAPAVHAGTVPAQQVGPEVIRTLLPPWGAVIFLVVILSGLSSTGDSALCAGSSLVAVDIFGRYIRSDASPETLLRMTRLAIVGMSVLAVAIAMIPGITILSLFLFYGTLRSATLMPTLLILFNARVTAAGIFRGVVLAILFGMPVYLIGQWTGNIHLKVGANIGIVLISLAVPLWALRNEKELLPGREGVTLP